METAATRNRGRALSSATTRWRSFRGTPVSLSRLNGRLRSVRPAATFTARLHAAMIRLATMITSVMAWIMVSRRAVEGPSASTVTGVPWSGNARSSSVRTRSTAPEDPFVATTTAFTGLDASCVADRFQEGQVVVDALAVCPRTFDKKYPTDAAVARGAHRPMAGVLASSSHATTPNDRPSCDWSGASWTTATPCTPGVARSSSTTEGGTEGTTDALGQSVFE